MNIKEQNKPKNIRFFVLYNNETAIHLHGQAELIVVLDGLLKATVDQIEYTVSPCHGIVIFPNQIHSLKSLGKSQILMCLFYPEFNHRYLECLKKLTPVNPFFCLTELSNHSRIAIDGLLALQAECPTDMPVPEKVLALAEGYLTLLLADVLNEMNLTDKKNAPVLELEQKLLIYIDTHFKDSLSLDILSNEFDINRFRLSRIFSERLKISFTHYVNSRRLEYAKRLLRSTKLSIIQIALESGFSSSRTFYREFSNHYGLTPKEYQKSCPVR